MIHEFITISFPFSNKHWSGNVRLGVGGSRAYHVHAPWIGLPRRVEIPRSAVTEGYSGSYCAGGMLWHALVRDFPVIDSSQTASRTPPAEVVTSNRQTPVRFSSQ